ncbi:glycosyltransferase [Marinobacter sp. SS8-8]|uniref:glycosyltransferase n=1 Tax=Marinobacter sp. SS8-8 TaxID=3050452 RepID=UPI0026DFC632|nr:glycosyltransferase family 2 protein [Marinobacter sp. SS8-8]
MAVILNWNGADDTVECVKSIVRSGESLDVLVIDNGSTDNTLRVKLDKAFFDSDGSLLETTLKGVDSLEVRKVYEFESVNIFLLETVENLGFSKGCNLGVRFSHNNGYYFSLILNNDTVVTPNFLGRLKGGLSSHFDFMSFPQIRYFSSPERIWNCGGRVTGYGRVKYYCANAKCEVMDDRPAFEVGFATGCCFLVRTADFVEIGLFTEKFFFGEEDVELSFRVNKSKRNINCVPSSIIYHKVGSSTDSLGDVVLRKGFIHYLNRIINMKTQLSFFKWKAWRRLVLIKVFLRLIFKYKCDFWYALNYVKSLSFLSENLNSVSKSLFFCILNNGLAGLSRK